MKTQDQASRFLNPFMWGPGAAILLFVAVGIGAVVASASVTIGDPGNNVALEAKSAGSAVPVAAQMNSMPAASSLSAHPRIRWCPVCGVVLSMRAVNTAAAGNGIDALGKWTGSHAVTVRFDDGSTRVISESNAPLWRMGQKVKVINGVIQADA